MNTGSAHVAAATWHSRSMHPARHPGGNGGGGVGSGDGGRTGVVSTSTLSRIAVDSTAAPRGEQLVDGGHAGVLACAHASKFFCRSS
jgi:hypothetical protein